MGEPAVDINPHLDLRVLRFRSNPARDEPAMLAQELIGRERYPEAVELTSAALERDPDDGDLLLVHGIALSRTGSLETAQLALMRAASVDREWVEPWRHLARVLLERDRPEQALAVAERALRLDAEDPIARRVHRDADLIVRARTYARDPGFEEPALLAEQLLAVGRPGLAFEVTRTALLEEIDDEDLLLAHARAAIALDDLDEALSVLKMAVFSAEDWPEVWRLLARVHELRGELELALEAAEEGLEIDPGDAELAAMMDRLGD